MNRYETPTMEMVYFEMNDILCLSIVEDAQFSEEESSSAKEWFTNPQRKEVGEIL